MATIAMGAPPLSGSAIMFVPIAYRPGGVMLSIREQCLGRIRTRIEKSGELAATPENMVDLASA